MMTIIRCYVCEIYIYIYEKKSGNNLAPPQVDSHDKNKTLQLHYYIHFQTNTLGKGMNLLILPVMG